MQPDGQDCSTIRYHCPSVGAAPSSKQQDANVKISRGVRYVDTVYRQGDLPAHYVNRNPRVLKDYNDEPVDFVICVRYIHCAVWQAVQQLNALYRPRYIWFISSRAKDCKLLRRFAPNVECVWESNVS